jgi:dienelactone hydrolase
MESLSDRKALLLSGIQEIGPDDDTPRPAVIIFHGCGGLRSHLPRYAEIAKLAGYRAFIVDSYGPRGWSRLRTLMTVCTNLGFRGKERASDILAAWDEIAARPHVKADQIVLAGWSHGGWSIMELMTTPLKPGALDLKDPEQARPPAPLGVFLAYAYVGPFAPSRLKTWLYKTRVFALTCDHDHLTTVRNAEKVNAAIGANGSTVESWIACGTHAFDEPTSNGPMKHNPELSIESLRRFKAWLEGLA